MTTPIVNSLAELERWMAERKIPAEAADEIRRKWKNAQKRSDGKGSR